MFSIFMSAEQERDLFLLKFQKYLVSEGPELSAGHLGSADLSASTVCRNLGKFTSAILVTFRVWL
jgi:hypothetical protein